LVSALFWPTFFGAYGTMVGHHGAWSDTMVNVFVGAGQELEQVPAPTFELEQVKVGAGTCSNSLSVM
jgi:hypothetical protein